MKRKKIVLFLIILLISCILLLNEDFRFVLKIIFISATLSYILRPFKKIISRHFEKLRNSTVSLIVILIFIIILGCVLFIIIPKSIMELSKHIPNINNTLMNIDKYISNLNLLKNEYINSIYISLKENIMFFINNMLNEVGEKVFSLTEKILSFSLIPILSYYFLSDSYNISCQFYKLIPLKKRRLTKIIVRDIDELLGKYIYSQIVLCVIIMIFTFVILLIFGIPFSFLLSFFNGVLNIVPYFGPVIGAAPIIIISFAKSKITGIWITVLMIILQQIEGNILSPKITGDNTNIHPLWILILLLIGDKTAGFTGMLLIIPAAVVVKVIYDDINFYLF